jgi:hypothetical protein
MRLFVYSIYKCYGALRLPGLLASVREPEFSRAISNPESYSTIFARMTAEAPIRAFAGEQPRQAQRAVAFVDRINESTHKRINSLE